MELSNTRKEKYGVPLEYGKEEKHMIRRPGSAIKNGISFSFKRNTQSRM